MTKLTSLASLVAAGLLSLSLGALSGCGSGTESSDDAFLTESLSKKLQIHPLAERRSGGDFDYVNAYWLARISGFAYSDDEDRRAELRSVGVSFGDDVVYRDFDVHSTGTQAFYLANDKFAVLAFRGTEMNHLHDLLTDGAVIKKSVFSGKVHGGFVDAFDSVWPEMKELLSQHHGFDERGQPTGVPLYITGHSLGAALATVTLSASVFGCTRPQQEVTPDCTHDLIPIAAMYTYGSPRVGDPEFAHDVSKRALELGIPIFRFVNAADEVTRAPRIDYKHLGLDGDEEQFLMYLSKDGELFPHRISDTYVERRLGSGVFQDHDIEEYDEKLLDLAE